MDNIPKNILYFEQNWRKIFNPNFPAVRSNKHSSQLALLWGGGALFYVKKTAFFIGFVVNNISANSLFKIV